MTPRVILVEGTSGAGKSTPCQWLNLMLIGDTAWYPEDGEPGGLRYYFRPERESVAMHGTELISRWSDFLKGLSKDQTIWIVESALLQVPIHEMLLADVDASS